MKPEKKQEHKEKLLSNLDKKIAEANERKSTIEANYKRDLETVENELDALSVELEALQGLK